MDAYADDRAIHALYPVVPRNEQGIRYDSAAYRTVLEHIEADGEVMIPHRYVRALMRQGTHHGKGAWRPFGSHTTRWVMGWH